MENEKLTLQLQRIEIEASNHEMQKKIEFLKNGITPAKPIDSQGLVIGTSVPIVNTNQVPVVTNVASQAQAGQNNNANSSLSHGANSNVVVDLANLQRQQAQGGNQF